MFGLVLADTARNWIAQDGKRMCEGRHSRVLCVPFIKSHAHFERIHTFAYMHYVNVTVMCMKLISRFFNYFRSFVQIF